MFIVSVLFGIYVWIESIMTNIPKTAGTIMLVALTIVVSLNQFKSLQQFYSFAKLKLETNSGGCYKMIKVMCMTGLILLFMTTDLLSKEVSFTLEDRDRLIRVEARLNEIDKRFESIDKRFESIDKRFESIDKRFDSIERQIDRQSIIFTALVVAVIGFAFWDRRTMIRPFEDKVREINKRIDKTDESIRDLDESKVSKLVDALREISATDSKVAGVLKRFNLL